MVTTAPQIHPAKLRTIYNHKTLISIFDSRISKFRGREIYWRIAMAKKLYVGNLSYEVTEDELSQLFAQCGQVTGARIVKDKDTGRSKGFGFVEMPNDDEATIAINRMKGHDLRGRPIMVDEAREKSGGAGGGRSFGGGRDGGRGRY